MLVDLRLIHTKNVAEHRLHEALNNSRGVVTLLVNIVVPLVRMINDQTVDIILLVLPTNEVVHAYQIITGHGVRKRVVHALTV